MLVLRPALVQEPMLMLVQGSGWASLREASSTRDSYLHWCTSHVWPALACALHRLRTTMVVCQVEVAHEGTRGVRHLVVVGVQAVCAMMCPPRETPEAAKRLGIYQYQT